MAVSYPNREHQKADERARRRALEALSHIEGDAFDLRKKLERSFLSPVHVDADDVQGLSDNLRKLTGCLAELGILYDAREWDAADKAEREGTRS